MTVRTWVILGATSIIAEEFARLAAENGHHLRLVGRNKEHLALIAQDLQIRYKVSCQSIVMDMTAPADKLITILNSGEQELDLFIAHSDFTGNKELNSVSITRLIKQTY